MYCKSCGKQIDNDSIYCNFCGKKQSSEFKPKTEEVINNKIEKLNGVDCITKDNKKNTNAEKHIKYDPTYKKDEDALVVGILLLVISITSYFYPIMFEKIETYFKFEKITYFISSILRIIIAFWVANIAKRQNREPLIWGVLALFLPSIVLIIIGTMRKRFANINIIDELNNEQNSKILSDKSIEYYDENKFSESIRFSKRAIELDAMNHMAKNILKKSEEAEIINQNSLLETLHKETIDGKNLTIVSKQNEIIGATITISELPAPDGVYYYKDWTQKLIVKDGVIKERLFIDKKKDLIIEKSEHVAKKGDKVFLDNGEKAPSGKYNIGLLKFHVIVEDGIFMGYDK